jgi:hypothetical protein
LAVVTKESIDIVEKSNTPVESAGAATFANSTTTSALVAK